MVSEGAKSPEDLFVVFGGGGRVTGWTMKLVTNSVISGQHCSTSKQGRYSICNATFDKLMSVMLSEASKEKTAKTYSLPKS